MASVLDRVDPASLAAAAEAVRNSKDVNLPLLPLWNYDACYIHSNLDAPDPLCRKCALIPRDYQRVAIAWFFLIRKGLLADQTGLGKTASAIGAIALAAQAGELDPRRGGGRVLVLCRPTALDQWRTQLRRMVPSLAVEIIDGTAPQRSDLYAMPWDIAVMGHHMFLRDKAQLQYMGIKHLVIDDVDVLRNCDNQTHHAIKMLALECDRVILMTATPLQKKLLELYDLLDSIGLARPIFGPREDFIRRYLRRQRVKVHTKNKNKEVVTRTKMEVVGYKNVDEFRELIAPRVLRRRLSDVEDVHMPELVSNNVFLDLHPAQRERYEELARGVLRILQEEGETISMTTASAKRHQASLICESLAALDEKDTQFSSVKFDWIVDKLLGDFSGESDDDPGDKMVSFVNYKPGLSALRDRLDAHGLGNVTIWGNDRSRKNRAAAVERFIEDPSCRVLLGTSAIEQSIDGLQVARHLVNVDQIPNPARMEQLAGRIQRSGSGFGTVYVHNLFAVDTHEERVLSQNTLEAALTTAVFGEGSGLYEALSPMEMMQLMLPSGMTGALASR